MTEPRPGAERPAAALAGIGLGAPARLVDRLSAEDVRRAALRTPVYYLIYLHLRSEIVSGRWAVGARLPSLTELGRRYGVRTPIVRAATDLLLQQGHLSSRSGGPRRVTSAEGGRRAIRA